MFSRSIEQSKATTEASFQVSYRSAQKCKPLSDGIKDIFERRVRFAIREVQK